jgi:hypothetical protein
MGWSDNRTYQVWGNNFPARTCRGRFDWICLSEGGGLDVSLADPKFWNAKPNFWVISDEYPWTYLGEYEFGGTAHVDFKGKTYTDILFTMSARMGIDQLYGIIVKDGKSLRIPYGYTLSPAGKTEFEGNRYAPVLLANDTFAHLQHDSLSKFESDNHGTEACGIVGLYPDNNITPIFRVLNESTAGLYLFRMIGNPTNDVAQRANYPLDLAGLDIVTVDLDAENAAYVNCP